MSADLTDSTQTWPKSRVTKDLAKDAKTKIKLSKTLDRARAFLQETTNQDSNDKKKDARDLIQNLYEALERNNTNNDNQSTNTEQSNNINQPNNANQSNKDRRRTSAMPPPNLHMIHEEPQFGSMIWCDLDSRLSRIGSHRASMSTSNPYMMGRFPFDSRRNSAFVIDGIASDNEQNPELNTAIDVNALYNNLAPFYIRAIPHLLLFGCAVGYVLLGALFFQYIDDDLQTRPYREVVCATIGWGSIDVVKPWTRIACVVYMMLGIPLIMCSFANMGRLLTEFYCIDWVYLSSVLRGKKATLQDFSAQLPIKVALNMLALHQLLGVVLFNGLIKEIGIVGSIYFSMTSMATIGFGDISPQPKNAWELIIILVYTTAGLIIISAVFISISYYIQLVYYGHLSEWLNSFYEPKTLDRKQSTKISPQKY